jgi:hypothetical protein
MDIVRKLNVSSMQFESSSISLSKVNLDKLILGMVCPLLGNTISATAPKHCLYYILVTKRFHLCSKFSDIS